MNHALKLKHPPWSARGYSRISVHYNQPSGMCCHVVWYTGTDVSQKPAAYIFRTEYRQGSRRFPKVVPINHTTWCHIPDEHNLNNSVIAKMKLL